MHSAGAAASSQQSPQQAPPSSPFSSSSAAKSSYVNAADEYLRVIEGSVKTLRSLIASRQQQVQAEHAAAPPRKQSKEAHKTAAAASASAAAASSASASSSSAELSELINYQVWFAMTSLSRLLVNPEPWHLSCLCAHPAIGSYAPFSPSSPLSAASHPCCSLSSSSTFASTSSLYSLLMHDGPAAQTPPACADGASTSSTLTPRSSSSSSLSSDAPSPSGSPTAAPSVPALTCPDMSSLATRTPTFDPPRLTPASSSLFAFNSASASSSRPALTLAFLPDILELDAQIKREKEEEERQLQQQRKDETAAGDSAWLTTPTAAHKSPGSLWSPPSPAAVDSPLSPPRAGGVRGRSPYLSGLEHVKIHFRQLLLSSSHPYGFALQSFIQHMQDERGDKMRRWLAEEKARRRREKEEQLSSAAKTGSGSRAEEPLLLAAASSSSSPRAAYGEQLEDDSLDRSLCQSYLQHAMTLLRSFIAHHYRLMLSSYPLLAATSLCRKVAYYVLQSIVYDSLSRTLSNLYEDVYSAEDDWMLEKLRLRSRTEQPISSQQQQQQPPAAVSDRDGWRRVRESRAQTIDLLREMLQAGQIREKLALVVAACRSVGKGRDEASSDDLIVVLCNCLLALSASPSSPPGSSTGTASSDDETETEGEGAGVGGSSACVSHLYSQVRMLNDCMDESMILGEKGFCMTTLTVAMQAIATADDDAAAAAAVSDK